MCVQLFPRFISPALVFQEHISRALSSKQTPKYSDKRRQYKTIQSDTIQNVKQINQNCAVAGRPSLFVYVNRIEVLIKLCSYNYLVITYV